MNIESITRVWFDENGILRKDRRFEPNGFWVEEEPNDRDIERAKNVSKSQLNHFSN